MGRRVAPFWLAAGLLCVAAPLEASHKRQTSAISDYCRGLDELFRNRRATIYAGPQPWNVLGMVPARMTTDELAYVYRDRGQVLLVFLRQTVPTREWAQDTTYYFREDGSLALRRRILTTMHGQLRLTEESYYQGGRLIKERSEHHPLPGQSEDTGEFEDEPAPLFLTAGDLPFEDVSDEDRGLI